MYGDDMDKSQMGKYQELGLNVSYYRRKCGLTQEELAELLDIARNHVSNIELAKEGVSLDIIFRMADVLKIPVHKLFEFRD